MFTPDKDYGKRLILKKNVFSGLITDVWGVDSGASHTTDVMVKTLSSTLVPTEDQLRRPSPLRPLIYLNTTFRGGTSEIQKFPP